MLSSAMASPFYQKFKKRTESFVDNFGEGAHYIAKRVEESLKLITPGMLFEEMGIEYIGPIDGHDLKSLIETLETAKKMGKPVIIHAQTLKGKGYEIAEGQHEKWHGVGPFDIESGNSNKKSASKKAGFPKNRPGKTSNSVEYHLREFRFRRKIIDISLEE